MDNEKDIITVIIPVYNTEKYLEECLESVINQSYSKLEIIIVDDGSKDQSKCIIEKYQNTYPERIKAIYQENQGQSAARNHALDIATGEYVVYVDSDDFIGENYIKALHQKAIDTNADMVLCDYTKVDEEGKIIKRYTANYCENELRIPSYISCNRIIKKKLLDNYKIRYKEGVICEDIPAMLELEIVAENIQVISLADYFYRTNPASTTLTIQKRKLQMSQLPFTAMDECVDFWKKYNRNIRKEELEFFVCRIWTSLIFDVGRKCDKITRKSMIKEIKAFMNKNFPNYDRNYYVKLSALPKLPKVQKYGTWIFVKGMKWNALNIISTIVALI